MEWISVKDRLPDSEYDVLSYYAPDGWAGCFNISFLEDGVWYNNEGVSFTEQTKLTHWMPLPKPPTT